MSTLQPLQPLFHVLKLISHLGADLRSIGITMASGLSAIKCLLGGHAAWIKYGDECAKCHGLLVAWSADGRNDVAAGFR